MQQDHQAVHRVQQEHIVQQDHQAVHRVQQGNIVVQVHQVVVPVQPEHIILEQEIQLAHNVQPDTHVVEEQIKRSVEKDIIVKKDRQVVKSVQAIIQIVPQDQH